MFNALDGTAKLTPGTYYFKLTNIQNSKIQTYEIKDFTFVFDKVKTISEKKDFETNLTAQTPVVFEYAHDICKDKYFGVEVEDPATVSHFEIETKDVSLKKDGSKLKERGNGDAIYNAFEVVGAANDTKAKIVFSQTIAEAVLEDISVDTWSSEKRTIDSTIRASRSYEATFSGKEYELDFGNHRDSLHFKVDVANSDETAISDDFKKNHFVRVQLFKEGDYDEFGHQDWNFDRNDQGVPLPYQTFNSIGENQSYRIRATLYNKADSSNPVAILISDNSKDESGNAVSNQIRTYGRVVIADKSKDEGKFTPIIGSNYVCLQFEYLDQDVSKILLRERGTEKYTVWSNFGYSAERQGKWDACPQIDSRKKYGYGLTPGTTYEILFLKNNDEYDKTNVGNTYFYEEDIITPQYKDGKPIEEPLTFTTKACEKAEVTVNETNIDSNSVSLKVVLDDWDTFFKYPYEDAMYFSQGFFNASKLKLEGKVKKDGATEGKAFACSVDVNTADGSGTTVKWNKQWRWGDESNPKCEIQYNGDRKSTITVYYTIDELEAATGYTISDLKLTYYGKELELTDSGKANKSITTKAAGTYRFDYSGDGENNAYVGDFRIKVPVKVSAAEGIIDTDTYDYKLEMKLQDAYGNDVEGFSDISKDGTTAELDTLTYGALKPDNKYYIHSSLKRKPKSDEAASYEVVAEDKHSFTTTSAKDNLTLSVAEDAIADTTAELTVTSEEGSDARALLEADKSLKGAIHYYVKDITGKAEQPAAVQMDDSAVTETSSAFNIKFEKLKPNTKYVGYIADSAEGVHISECEFTTGNKENAINVKVVPVLKNGSMEIAYTGFEDAEDLTDWKNYSFFYFRRNKGAWIRKYFGNVQAADRVLRISDTSFWGAGNTYDYVIMLSNTSGEFGTLTPDANIEKIKSSFAGKDNVLIVENGFRTPAVSPYEIDYDGATEGVLKVSYSAADNINTISLKLGTPGDIDKIKVVAQLAEDDGRGCFKTYSEGEEIKAEAIFSKTGDYKGELSFENLRRNHTYYLKNVDVYADLTDTEAGYESLLTDPNDAYQKNTISFLEPDKAPRFISGSEVIEDYSDFTIAGLFDIQDTGKKNSDGSVVYRGYDGLQDEADQNAYIVAYEKKGDKYALKLADINGNDIENILSWFDVRIYDTQIATLDGDSIKLLKSGETKIIITPKTDEKYRKCPEKEITLKVKLLPKKPETADVYAFTDVQKKLSDIDLKNYGYGAEWAWSEPDTALSEVSDDSLTKDGVVKNYNITISDDLKDAYYPMTISQSVKPRKFKEFKLSFIDRYDYKEGDETKTIKGGAQLSEDGKIAAVFPSTGSDCLGALVSAEFNYYGQGKNDEFYTIYEWEKVPNDVVIDKTLPNNERDGAPATSVDQFSAYNTHDEGVKLKLCNLYTGHYNGDSFVKDIALVTDGLITEAALEDSALKLYVKNEPTVNTAKIMAEVQAVKKDISGKSLIYNTETFEGVSIPLKPVFYDAKGGKLSSAKVKYSVTSSNTETAEVTKGEDGSYVLGIKNKVGDAVVTLNINDGVFNKSIDFKVKVTAFTPETTIEPVIANPAYDYNTVEGKALAAITDTPVGLKFAEGTTATSIVMAEVCAMDENGEISYAKSEEVGIVKGNEDGQYFISPNIEIKKPKTYQLIITVRNEIGSGNYDSATYVYPVSVKTKTSKVKATAKKLENYNLFFKAGAGKISVILTGLPYLDENNNAFGRGGVGTEFEWEDDDTTSATNGFSLSIDDTDGKKDVQYIEKKKTYTYSFSFRPDDIEVNKNKLSNKKITSGLLTLYLKGYKDPVVVKAKLPVKYQKPKLKVYAEDICLDKDKKDGRFIILDANKNVYGYSGQIDEQIAKAVPYSELTCDNEAIDVAYKDKLEKVAFDKKGKAIDWDASVTGQKFTYSGTKSSDKAKLTLHDENWREDLTLVLKIKSVKAK